MSTMKIGLGVPKIAPLNLAAGLMTRKTWISNLTLTGLHALNLVKHGMIKYATFVL